MSVGKETIVTNTPKPIRQDVKQETAYELANLKTHDFAVVTVGFAVLSAVEADVTFVEIDQPAIGDCDPMSIPRKIGQYALRAAELLDVHRPFHFAQWRQRAIKCFALA